MHVHRRLRAAIVLASLSLAALPAVAGAPAASAAPSSDVDRQVIVEWRDGTTDVEKADALSDVHPQSVRDLSADPTITADVDLVTLRSSTDTDRAIERLQASGAVLTAEPNTLLHAATQSLPYNDPLLADGTMWHLLGPDTKPGNEYGINAVSTFRRGIVGSSDVYVGVIDEGIDYTHPDLAANVWTNPFDPVNGRDDDHNGFVDDVHGWDFVHDDSSVFDGTDPNILVDWHGTAMAGEIAATLGNAAGGAGAAPSVKLISGKFLGDNSGTSAGAIAALDYLTDLKLRHGLNIVATSNSWEGSDTSEALLAIQDAIQRGADAGIAFVTIAGNGDARGVGYDLDTTPNYPASLTCHFPTGGDCMIVATAIDKTGKLGRFANFGATTVDIAAPGVSVTSTAPFDRYLSATGTSNSGPLVAAAYALYRSQFPSATPTAARQAVLASAHPTKALQGVTATGGRLDLARLFP